MNEWLRSDLDVENGEEKQKDAYCFLESLYKKCDRIAVARCSKFQQKEWKFLKGATDLIKRKIVKFYINAIRWNPQKYEEIDTKEEEVPDLEGINPDNFYLVKTYYKIKTEAKANVSIITTNNKLMNILNSKSIQCNTERHILKKLLVMFFIYHP